MYHIGFIVEQILGHVTHTMNLQASVSEDPTVSAQWGLPVPQGHGLMNKLPLFGRNWTVQCGLQSRRMIKAMRRQQELDVLFFHTQVTAVLAQSWVRTIPSVVSLDATPKQYDRLGEYYAHKTGPKWLERLKWKLNRNLFREAYHIVSMNHWAKESLVDEYEVPPEKVTVIPPGVPTRYLLRPDPRQHHGEPIKILFVGGNMKRKGGWLLLDAFRQLRTEHENGQLPAVELHLVTFEKVEATAGVHVYNDMKANSDQFRQLYFDCDIFCLPSYGDCQPIVLAEAGAAGLPLVSTTVGGIPEIVRNRETGFILPPGDAKAITEALRGLVIDPDLRTHMGDKAKELVLTNFDVEKNTRRLLELLKTVVDNTRDQ